ncbi:hypothetical protein [Arthrobacter sulfonylureivorans]|uniref:Uncharacterized protein n=1 Tax=Arthrobacter sulfonylureivorans TaxID=2486855 RepID=A0ABY3WBE7_9MICC|nr:hypothetical protein [Arthrobacter sulfonylureivorans]UNK45878.1 hypothetical protein MNQ99_00355 [Arthrobacter sulfonylureivorans]
MTDIDPRAPKPAELSAPNIHLAPAAAAKLTAEQQAKLAPQGAKAGDLPGWHSIGNSHKPKHPSGKQGPPEKKVRW